MGQAKNSMMDAQDTEAQAVQWLIEEGHGEECEYHPGTYLGDLTFELDEIVAKAQKNPPDFLKGKDVEAVLRSAAAQFGDTCYSCDKNREED